jgi:hypothetical protein
MARRGDARGQGDTIRKVVIFSGIIGVLVLIGAVASGVRLSPEWQVKSNPSDQPSVSSGPRNTSGSRETTGDNSGTSGNATRQGSGPPGSGTGSPGGSSGNVQDSTPQSGERSGVSGSSTR